jgi:GTP cyclohydrolase I
MMRGVKKTEASMTTSAMLGKFKKGKMRKEFLDHVARSRFDE